MNSIWRNDGGNWRLLAPSGFPDERTLHDSVEKAPEMLPLAGKPSLVIVGREVSLGYGYADLLAVEQSGRLVIIEVKLSKNAEARRAIVAQILTYAAYLRGMDRTDLELTLADYLRSHQYANLTDAARAGDLDGVLDVQVFADGLAESLARGRFRLVLVLDSAPQELIQLVGYLESVASELLIDLIVVSSYQVGDSQILVPQRVEPEQQRREAPSPTVATRTVQRAVVTPGAEEFSSSIPNAPVDQQPILQRLSDWAASLEKEGLARLWSTRGTANRWMLLPRLSDEDVGLVTIYNEKGAYLALHRTVFERRVPNSIPRIEALIAPDRLGQGTVTRRISTEVLDALTDAYREAVGAISSTP